MSSSFSRSSSPLSDVDSASSSPAPNTPPPIRSPSLVFSSPDPSGPANQDEEDDELAPAATTSYFDPSSLPTAPCLWGDCNEEFWELEPFIDHLHNGMSAILAYVLILTAPRPQFTRFQSMPTILVPRRLSSTSAIGQVVPEEERTKPQSSLSWVTFDRILERSPSTVLDQVGFARSPLLAGLGSD